MARWLNLSFNSPEFWDLVENESFPLLIEAYHDDTAEEMRFKREVLNALFWLGNMTSEQATGVLNALGAKLTVSVGQVHLPAEWKERMQAEKDRIKRISRDPKKWKSLQ